MAKTTARVDFDPRAMRKQAFVLAPKGTKLFRSATASGEVVGQEVGGLPLPCWPDGSWCIELAGYMQTLARKGLSLADNGGTPGAYASQLSHVVRECYALGVDFHELSNAQFEDFIKSLTDEMNGSEPARSTRRVGDIGRRTLDFLSYIGTRCNIPDLVSLDGPYINGERRSYEVMLKNGGKTTRYYWHHNCFPPKSPAHVRYPVPEDYIAQMRRTAGEIKSSHFLKRRRLTLLRILEVTGARRIEVANMLVKDILNAKEMTEPFLRMPTFKRGGGEPEWRVIPVKHSDLDFIIEYIKFYRKTIVSKKFLKGDHGVLFVSEKTGKPIRPNTITLELHLLRKAAGFVGRAHPHLFRHRYITMAVFRLIRAYRLRDADHFADLMITGKEFAHEVMQRTGHKDIKSLQRYVDWAFALSGAAEGKLDEVNISELARSGRATVTELEAMKESMSPEEFAKAAMAGMIGLVDEMSKVDGEKRSPDALARLRSVMRE
ncbi:site-specific integrase [Caballeronia sordidicola]|uniref:site-specific integrase n=1 Tax=Caballeronia sordidicola TaxID=196367 RepID=UPI0004D00666|nr:site-specific integrase [Caballeronia sordidicola]